MQSALQALVSRCASKGLSAAAQKARVAPQRTKNVRRGPRTPVEMTMQLEG